ncbi:DNA phosphorothioation-dependent restriction protein DptF [Pantoea sp. WMus005]|uniref:DNA phosphorothioation-dependent restriction protein DptF n=1 Tax=Pantoea sp. WMus005 TaxID=2750734 RepID=UPI0015D00D07|nr:DNA phosphorothioation-dependent restriction protein DptF [Pantoea sp. WMus005]NYS30424.1 DNA phosphorothioation-dependent restriction protein DptF [Pantoea sp. WMus005]
MGIVIYVIGEDTLNFYEALNVLSKSSKYSVSTLRMSSDIDEFQRLKDHLYVESEIQEDVAEQLKKIAAGDKEIICLCGSSGDGKSEILTKLYGAHKEEVIFHLDATHSNSQHKSAVECLNDRFVEYKKNEKPLVIGINIGMLQKFIKQGCDTHSEIKNAIERYFNNRKKKGFSFGGVSFYDFECYPRISFSKEVITSDFIKSFLNKLTEKSDENPFYNLYLSDKKAGGMISKNFDVLSLPGFQDKLIELFGLARLLDEQFLIPRVFVDFIFQILTKQNDDGIVGNVFSDFDNAFSKCFQKMDPVKLHNKAIDDFYLQYATNSFEEDGLKLKDKLNLLTGHKLSSKGIIRASLMFKNYSEDVFIYDLEEEDIIKKALKYYLKLIAIYEKDELNSADENACLDIIEGLIVNSVLIYSNRMLNERSEGFIVSRSHESYSICNKINVQADLDSIEKHKLISYDKISIPLILNNDCSLVIDIDINTIIQCIKISQGYRPNRQNLESVAKLDEMVRRFVEKTKSADSLRLLKGKRTILIDKHRNRYRVEG